MSIGHWGSGHKRGAVALVICLPVILVACNSEIDPAKAEAERLEFVKERCATDREELFSQARQSLAADDPVHAWSLLAPCRKSNTSPEFKALIQTADAAIAVKNKKDTAAAAIVAAEKVKADAIQAKADKISAAAAAKIDKARKKKEGVSIGMSKQDVLDSSWGRPRKVNTTTTARGESEQWVYGDYGDGYLYFNNGTLTTIQN